MQHDNGQWWIAYNGEIFNHAALRGELPAKRYLTGTDTETLLHGLACWGEAAIPRCNGLFAYAAVDLERSRVLLVRDRFGVKPLYCARHAGVLWFASEIRALLAAGVPARADPRLLDHELNRGWLGGRRTSLAGISKVLPGTFLSVDMGTGDATERRWYDPVDAVDPDLASALQGAPRRGLMDELEAALRNAVQRRLMADVPIGTMCSGGLDSSLITSLASDEHPSIHAYNASVSDQPEVDEGPWAELAASSAGVSLHTVRMTGDSWRAGLVEAACHNEHPLVHESSVPMAQIAALARSHGVKVLLSGEGADELFGGYPWQHEAEHRDFAARSKRAESLARSLYRWLQRRRATTARGDHGAGEDPVGDSYELTTYARALAAYGHHGGNRRRLEAALLSDLRLYLPHLLNRQDKNTMQHSIETRVPFLDPELVAFAANLPLEARIEPQRKALLRELAARYVPAAIAARPKIGFGFDIDRCIGSALRPSFLGDGHLRELLARPVQDWTVIVDALRGQQRLIFVTAEILCRSLIDGQSGAAIERELWYGGT